MALWDLETYRYLLITRLYDTVHADALQTLFDRYVELYPEEAKFIRIDFNDTVGHSIDFYTKDDEEGFRKTYMGLRGLAILMNLIQYIDIYSMDRYHDR